MAIVFTNCPQCGGRLDESENKIVPGKTVWRCGRCQIYRLEKDNLWIDRATHPDVAKALLARAEKLEDDLEKEQRFRDMLESDIDDDPRWTRLW